MIQFSFGWNKRKDLRDRKIITFTVLEGKIDSSLDDFSLEIFIQYLLQKNLQDLNRFPPLKLQNLFPYNP